MDELELPELVLLEDYGGNYNSYIDAVYDVFRNDFVQSRPSFQGRPLRLKRHPIFQNREYTFYHMTHEGRVEEDRTPDLRRCERIGYVKVLIENSNHPSLKVWETSRKGNKRIVIYHEEERYVVILDDRGEYLLPWTAFTVDYENYHRKLIKDYEEYNK